MKKLVKIITFVLCLSIVCQIAYAKLESFTFEDTFGTAIPLVTGGNQPVGSNYTTSNIRKGNGNMKTEVTGGELVVKGWGGQSYPSAVNFVAPHSTLAATQIIEFKAYASSNTDFSFGGRFMVHNNENNYYEYRISPNTLSALPGSNALYSRRPYFRKVVNGSVVSGSEIWDLPTVSTPLNVTSKMTFIVKINGAEITWNLLSNTGTVISSGSYTDASPFNIAGESSTFQFLAVGDYYAKFDDFKIRSLMPYSDFGEPTNVMYTDLAYNKAFDSNNIMDLGELLPIRRVHFDNSNDVSKIMVSVDNVNWVDLANVTDFVDGKWLNTNNSIDYRYIKMDTPANVAILTDVYTTDNKKIFVNSGMSLYPRINGEMISDSSWTMDKPSLASFDNGKVYAFNTGEINFTAKKDAVTLAYKLLVQSEMDNAVTNGNVSEYIASKKAIVDEINLAITNKDVARLKAVILGTGTIKLKDIKDFNYVSMSQRSSEQVDAIVNRLIIDGVFADATGNVDIISIKKLLIEIAVGMVCGISSTDDLDNAIISNNLLLNCDLVNKYFGKYRNICLDMLKNSQFESIVDFQRKFVNSYTMAAFKNTIAYGILGAVLEDNKVCIGYDEVNYNGITDKNELYINLLSKKDSVNSPEDLKNAINSFTPAPPVIVVPPVRHSSGGGGGGSSTISFEAKPVVEPINVDKPLYSDIDKNHWAYEGVKYLTAVKAISGYENNDFKPNNEITRSEFAKILISGLNITYDEKSEIVPFDDIKADDWYYKYFMAAKVNEIILGYDNKCSPTEKITREEMAAIIFRALKIKGTVIDSVKNPIVFADESKISEWAFPAVINLYKYEIINGMTEDAFEPYGYATRAQVAKTIANLIFKINAKEADASVKK